MIVSDASKLRATRLDSGLTPEQGERAYDLWCRCPDGVMLDPIAAHFDVHVKVMRAWILYLSYSMGR